MNQYLIEIDGCNPLVAFAPKMEIVVLFTHKLRVSLGLNSSVRVRKL